VSVAGHQSVTGQRPAVGADGTAAAARKVGSAPLPAATTRRPASAVSVLTDTAPEALTVQVARTLFTTSPVVVVAAEGTAVSHTAASHTAASRTGTEASAAKKTAAADVAAAGHAAREAHAPLLLAPKVTAQLAAGIGELRPRTVMDEGLPVTTLAAALPGVRVVTRAAELPATGVPEQFSRLAVLVHGPTTGPAAAAIADTTEAAGATVVPVSGWDPRADAASIETLARLRPSAVVGIGKAFGPVAVLKDRLAVAETGRQLPGGGQVMFPGRRLVALYGHPDTPGLGALGQQDLPASIARAKKMAAQYRPLGSVPVVPAFEIIATVAQGAPGADGTYSYETPTADLEPWVQAATKAGMYVVLDLQPGRANLLTQAKKYTRLLKLPNVGLALDPEWKLQPGQLPLRQIGHVDIDEVNSVVTWLAALTARYDLPQKLLVLHQFQLSMITGERNLDTGNDDLAIVIHMDGQGTQPVKQATWDAVTGAAPRGVFFGWKNFFVKDDPMLTPQQTMTKIPTPVMISYQ